MTGLTSDIYNNITDEEIIAMLEGRDEMAMGLLESRFSNLIRSTSIRILGNEQDAEECVNDVLLKIWNSIPPNKPSNLKAYVAVAAKNNAIDRYKAQRRKGRIPPEKLEPLETADNIGVCDIDRDDKETVAALIADYLNGVSSEKRKCFIAKFYFGAKDSEIARKAGVPVGTVSSTLSRMRKELIKKLKTEGIRL